jgi:hypothetical protein
MELLTWMESRNAWAAFSSVLQGLRKSRGSRAALLLVTRDPVAELDDLVSALALLKTQGGRAGRLAVASPCPSLDWISAVRSQGVDKIYFLLGPGDGHQVSPDSMLEIPDDICPALHVRMLGGKPTRVCGNLLDVALPGRTHLAKHCLARWRDCCWARRAAAFVSAALS